jgi:acetolactate synthase-1/2/3 large subunit
MSAAEIETAVRERVPFVISGLGRRRYGSIGWKQDIDFWPTGGRVVREPGFVQLAESFGHAGTRSGRR